MKSKADKPEPPDTGLQFDKTVSAKGTLGPETSERRLEIRNKRGLHARAAAKFVKCAEQFDAEVVVIKDRQAVAATSIMTYRRSTVPNSRCSSCTAHTRTTRI